MINARLPAIVALTTVLLAGCAAPSIHPEVASLQAGALGLGPAPAPVIADAWWTGFGDPQLDRIMTDALDASPTLAAALARIRIAEAEVSGQRAGARPHLDIDAQDQLTRLSSKYTIPPPYGGTTRWVGTAQGNFSWTLDFWGQQAAMVDQARKSARAASLDAAAARLALAGSVAQTYVELVRAERLEAIAASFVTSREKSLELVRSRIRNQLASRFDERAADTLLAQARQAQVRAAGQRETIVHALAALAGRGADYYPSIGRTSLILDTALPLPQTLPADLLGRRPDLLAGLARIDAAAAGRKVARTAYYPNVNLLGLAGLQALGIGALFSAGASTYGLGPSLHLPIFEGGKLRADYAGATGQLDLATADYDTAVLRAVREAADSISQVRTSAADAAEQARLLEALQDVVRLDRTRTGAGLGSQLDILDSGTRLLAAQQTAVDIAANGTISRVQLLVALGGGFGQAADVAVSAAPSSQARP